MAIVLADPPVLPPVPVAEPEDMLPGHPAPQQGGTAEEVTAVGVAQAGHAWKRMAAGVAAIPGPAKQVIANTQSPGLKVLARAASQAHRAAPRAASFSLARNGTGALNDFPCSRSASANMNRPALVPMRRKAPSGCMDIMPSRQPLPIPPGGCAGCC
jgi:hypothetical protein